MINADTKIYNVPEHGLEWLRKKVERINKKSTKLGTGGIEIVEISSAIKEHPNGTADRYHQIMIDGEIPQIKGYDFIARLNHNTDPSGDNNLIYTMPGKKLPKEFRSAAANCGHCGYRRNRRDTFILFNEEDSSYIQVGRTCITDFLGEGDPERFAKKAEWISNLHDDCGKAEKLPYDGNAINNDRLIILSTFLSYVAQDIREVRWVSGKEAHEQGYNSGSTRWRAIHAMCYEDGIDPPTKEDKRLAEDAIAWAAVQDKSKSDFWHNIVVIANERVLSMKASGVAACIVKMYKDELKRKEENANKPDYSNSVHFANVGDKVKGTVTVLNNRLLPMRNNQAFQSRYVRMISEQGNILVTFATGRFNPAVGATVTIKGTVGKNDEFNGVKQTIIKRAAIAA